MTGTPSRRPAHAARPGLPAAKIGALLAAAVALATAGWLGALVWMKSSGPTSTAPVSASLITVSLTPSREHPGLP